MRRRPSVDRGQCQALPSTANAAQRARSTDRESVPSDLPEHIALLCHRHRHELLGVARSTLALRFSHWAEDIVSDVVTLILLGRLAAVKNQGTEAAQLAYIKGVIRHRSQHVNRDESRFASGFAEAALSGVGAAWRRADAIFRRRDVMRAVSQLTPRERELVMLHWIRGWSCPDIAHKLEISPKTVKELLRRARRKLGVALARVGEATKAS